MKYTRTRFHGVRKMTHWLRGQGWEVNPKRVRRLMRQMGLEAIYPKPRLSAAAPGHRIYPYRLRGVAVVRPNQVWATDLTYIRMRQGFVYLVAVMDWFSRYVLSWEISVTADAGFCVAALEWALQEGRPEIFNSDQGAQFTRKAPCDFAARSGHGSGREVSGCGTSSCNLRPPGPALPSPSRPACQVAGGCAGPSPR